MLAKRGHWFERTGTLGAVVAAALCPVCFPKLALLGAALGLGVFAPYEGVLIVVVLIFAGAAWAGHAAMYRRHRRRALLALATAATVLLYVGYFVAGSSLLMQASLVALAAASVWLAFELRRCARCAQSALSAEPPDDPAGGSAR
ncbi:MAG: hypothetical protein OHK0044_18330 [Burkholderiaceae bacterium]